MRIVSKLLVLSGVVMSLPTYAVNVILEFKGAYFLPTASTFKHIYGGGALYGPELSVQLGNNQPWYAFGSFDYFHAKGCSLGLADATAVTLVPLGLGLKYMEPVPNQCMDVYLGLGFQAVDVRTADCIAGTIVRQNQWGFGGIAKAGVYWYLPHNFVIDLFIDYSFTWVGSCHTSCTSNSLQPQKANISGTIFGAALGYVF